MAKKFFLCFVMALFLLISSDTAIWADQSQIVILLYHHVIPNADYKLYFNTPWVVPAETLESQMEYLYKNQYHTVTTDELRSLVYDKKPLPQKSVMITFDDGYLSNYLYAYPILKQFGFKAIIFAITSNIQTKDQDYHPDQLDMLSWMEVAASSDVFEYGSHTHDLHNTGADGKTRFVSASLDQAKADLQLSLKRIHNRYLFAYPGGQYNANLVDMVKNSGVVLAFTTNKGYVNQNSNPLLLNRVTVYPDFSLSTFESVVTCNYKY